jgi:hypothetical protein
MNYRVEETHKSNIRVGDTIIHNGEMKTVSGNNLKRSEFMGVTLFGDSYQLGYNPVKKVIFIKP